MALSRAEARARERILTQPEPAKIRKSTDAVVLKRGGLFLVAAEGGDVPFTLPHAYGLFYRDCRFLDGYTLRLDGVDPVVLGGTTERSVIILMLWLYLTSVVLLLGAEVNAEIEKAAREHGATTAAEEPAPARAA